MGLLRDPSILVIVGTTAIWYWRGSWLSALRAVAAQRRRRPLPWRGACFGAGLIVILVALDSPLERRAHEFFWAHMLQHVLLMMMAAPLIVLGAPWMPLWRPLPLVFRRRVARALAKSPSLGWLRRAAGIAVRPWCAWTLFNVDLALWHIPTLYDLTLRNTTVHYVEHASFILLGLLFWSQVIESPPFHARLGQFGRVVYTTTGSAASWVLAVVLAIAPTPLYPAQETAHPGGLSALGDQQLAAGVMLGPGSIPYAIVVFYCLYVWLAADEPRRGRRRAPRSALGTGTR
jgi:putative membrane protein